MGVERAKALAGMAAIGFGVTALVVVPDLVKRPRIDAEPPAVPPAVSYQPRSLTFSERLEAHVDLPGAIALSRSYFADAVNDTDPAGVTFALWAARFMTWQSLQAVEETKRALVLKDSAVERGYRVCTSGSIVQIRVVRNGNLRFAEGIMMNGAWEPTQFIAVGSSGELVEKSPARFCGVVVGRYTYSNSGGGTSHAITLVGMFDIPENKAKPAAAAR